jgi:hypothetical protein
VRDALAGLVGAFGCVLDTVVGGDFVTRRELRTHP